MAEANLDAYKQGVVEEKKCCCSKKKLKIGIIGTGWIADAHASSYLKQPDVEIVALADLIPGKAEAFAKKHGIEGARYYGEHTEMLAAEKELDAVSVCTYNRTHAVCTIDSLNAGIPVLLEKPMCVTLDEAVAAMAKQKRAEQSGASRMQHVHITDEKSGDIITGNVVLKKVEL